MFCGQNLRTRWGKKEKKKKKKKKTKHQDGVKLYLILGGSGPNLYKGKREGRKGGPSNAASYGCWVRKKRREGGSPLPPPPEEKEFTDGSISVTKRGKRGKKGKGEIDIKSLTRPRVWDGKKKRGGLV